MSKERLEEMNKKVTGLTDSDGDFADAVKMDVDTYAWFYEQAERVQELEEEVEYLSHNFGIEAEQNKRYREAVKEAIEEEEQNLEGYESNVYKILLEVMEESK